MIFKPPISSEIFDLSKNQESPKCVFGIFGEGSWAQKFYLNLKLKRYVKKTFFGKFFSYLPLPISPFPHSLALPLSLYPSHSHHLSFHHPHPFKIPFSFPFHYSLFFPFPSFPPPSPFLYKMKPAYHMETCIDFPDHRRGHGAPLALPPLKLCLLKFNFLLSANPLNRQ